MTQESDELLRLASADNFRDVAGPGYRTMSGARLRTGVCFRSNELQLTDADAEVLASVGVTDVYDLRDQHEVDEHPDVGLGEAQWHHVPVAGIAPGAGAQLESPEATRDTMHAIYRSFVTAPAARRSFATILRAIATTETPQLFHCTAGKDRTGWTTVMLHHVAGVPAEVTLTDYLLTNEISTATRAKYLGMIAEHLGEDRVPIFEPLMVVDESYLTAAFAAAEAEYGSLDHYLREGLGLDDETLAALRERLVDAGAPPPPAVE